MRAYAVRERESCRLQTPYDALFLHHLKEEIPATFRAWDPASRVWRVDEPYVGAAIALTRKYFAVTVDDRRRTAPVDHRRSGTWAELLFAAVPERLHPHVFRALSKALHPDAGGDAVAMQTLNSARDRLPRKSP